MKSALLNSVPRSLGKPVQETTALQPSRQYHALKAQCKDKCQQVQPVRGFCGPSAAPVAKKSGNFSLPLAVFKRNVSTDCKSSLQDKSNSISTWRTLSTSMSTSRHVANASHRCSLAQDLTTFLLEVGTAGKEARYWLKQFQQSLTHHDQPFAVMHIDYKVFRNEADVIRVGKCLSFLQRNGMKPIVVVGYSSASKNDLWSTIDENEVISPEKLQDIINELNSHVVSIVNAIEEDGALCRPMFYGTAMLQADQVSSFGARGLLRSLDEKAVKWCLSSNHLPVIPSIGLSSSGQLLVLDPFEVTAELTRKFMPVKVMFLNESGGLRDEYNQIIANINLPNQLDEYLQKSWCSPQLKYRLLSIHQLLCNLPSTSSVIVTSACTILKELFTHRGSGTFFKNTESIHTYESLTNIELERLGCLINQGFGMVLKDDYFKHLDTNVSTVYVSHSYNAAAIITHETGLDIPYLDKFVVSKDTQGQGTSEILWAHLKRDFPKLFWRSRNVKEVTPWYFKRAEGSWTQGEWTVFWYGVCDVKLSQKLIEFALNRPSSFNKLHSDDSSTVSDTYSSTVPDTYSSTVPDTYPTAVPDTYPSTVPDTYPTAVPGTFSSTV